MNVIIKWLSLCSSFVVMQFCTAQSLTIDTVFVKDIRNHDSMEIQKLHFDLDAKSTLYSNTHISINLQGVNSLTTVINRGQPSKLFGVFYHGLRLNSTTNNTFDINLLPTFYFNNTSINSNGNISESPFNSSAGMLNLSQSDNANTISFNQHIRQYSDYETNFIFNNKSDKFNFRIGGNLINYTNRFGFYKNDIKQKSESLISKGYNVLADFKYEINLTNKLEIGLWHQNYERELPEIFHRKGDQWQRDRSTKLNINYTKISKQYILRFNTTASDEELIYKTINLNSIANTMNILLDASIKTKGNWEFHLGSKLDQAQANFFLNTKNRKDFYTSIEKRIIYKKISVEAILSQHYVDNNFTPIAGELSFKKNNLKLTVIKNFNLPGFNDLYWPIGGNINLIPEKSWQNIIDYNTRIHKKLNVISSLYTYSISDFIQWLPTDKGYWSPINVRNIWSRGLELGIDFKSKIRRYDFQNSLKYTFTKSTYEDSEAQKGKQLIYVPLHKITNNTSISTKKISLLLNSILTGKRYETTDNFISLNPFLLINAKVECIIKYRKFNPKIGISVDNITNENYEFIRSFPMPLRRFSLDFKIIFNHKNHTNEIK